MQSCNWVEICIGVPLQQQLPQSIGRTSLNHELPHAQKRILHTPHHMDDLRFATAEEDLYTCHNGLQEYSDMNMEEKVPGTLGTKVIR